MKVLDKIALVLFSSIILIVSVLIGFMIFGWINIDTITIYIKYALNNPTATNVILGVIAIFILLAIKGIFFSSDEKADAKENGILIQNENGKLFISKDTIQNIVSGTVKETQGAQDVYSKVVLANDNAINIDVVLYVLPNVIIKDLSSSLQQKIKTVIKKSMDIDIKEVNITIKNITTKPENA